MNKEIVQARTKASVVERLVEVLNSDAIHILRQIGNSDKEKTLKESIRYKNFTPHTDDQTFKKRFERTWMDAFE